MATLCEPSVVFPEETITLEQTLDMAERVHGDNPELPLALRLIQNTGVRTRNIVQPIADTLRHPGVEARTEVHDREARRFVPIAVDGALANAEVGPEDIDVIVFVSCTGFSMPSLTAWMINELGFRPSTAQIPMAQLGCAAGGAAIARALDYCRAHPGSNALIVCCEFCSLCYQPTDIGIGSLLSDGLFGDAVAAAVVSDGTADTVSGVELLSNASYVIPDTVDWISYAVRSTGFHFQLDKRVPGTMEPLAPVLRSVADAAGWDASDLDFYIIHAGGPRILDDLSKFLDVHESAFRHSRETLTHHGNIASAVVLDALRRMFREDSVVPDGRGVVAGFGPGITAEMSLGRWVAGQPA